MDTEPRPELLEAAASWYARLSAADCNAEERARFAEWFSSDGSHAEAFFQIKRAADATARLAQADPRLAALADAALAGNDAWGKHRSAKRSQWAWGLAAGVLLCLGVLRWAPSPESTPLESATYSTALERRAVTLSDGSRVQLDAGSAIRVDMYAARRAIHLERGRAYFKVAHDAARPFAVTADGVRTVALGTAFQVQQNDGGVVVTLLEGSVLVSDVSRQLPDWEEKLIPGDQLFVRGAHAPPERHVVDVARVSSWTRGRHVFEHMPLADAVAEINRYSERKLRLGDASLGALEVGGSFVMGDTEQIARAIATALPVDVVAAGPKEIILFRRHEPSLD